MCLLKRLIPLLFISFAILQNSNSYSQTKEDKTSNKNLFVEIAGGLAGEGVFLLSKKNISEKLELSDLLLFGWAGSVIGVNLSGKYINSKSGSLKKSIIGGGIGSCFSFLTAAIALGDALSTNKDDKLLEIFAFTIIPVSAAFGYNVDYDKNNQNKLNYKISPKIWCFGKDKYFSGISFTCHF